MTRGQGSGFPWLMARTAANDPRSVRSGQVRPGQESSDLHLLGGAGDGIEPALSAWEAPGTLWLATLLGGFDQEIQRLDSLRSFFG